MQDPRIGYCFPGIDVAAVWSRLEISPQISVEQGYYTLNVNRVVVQLRILKYKPAQLTVGRKGCLREQNSKLTIAAAIFTRRENANTLGTSRFYN